MVLDDKELEELCVYARYLRPLLRQAELDQPLDLSGVELTRYRLKKQGEHRLNLKDGEGPWAISSGDGVGGGHAHTPEKGSLAEIIARLNELFGAEQWSDGDRLSYMNTVMGKVLEREAVVTQIEANESADQIMLGDFPAAVQEAVLESLNNHSGPAKVVLQDEQDMYRFARIILYAILNERRHGPEATK